MDPLAVRCLFSALALSLLAGCGHLETHQLRCSARPIRHRPRPSSSTRRSRATPARPSTKSLLFSRRLRRPSDVPRTSRTASPTGPRVSAATPSYACHLTRRTALPRCGRLREVPRRRPAAPAPVLPPARGRTRRRRTAPRAAPRIEPLPRRAGPRLHEATSPPVRALAPLRTAQSFAHLRRHARRARPHGRVPFRSSALMSERLRAWRCSTFPARSPPPRSHPGSYVSATGRRWQSPSPPSTERRSAQGRASASPIIAPVESSRVVRGRDAPDCCRHVSESSLTPSLATAREVIVALTDLGWGVLCASGPEDSFDLSLIARPRPRIRGVPFIVVHAHGHASLGAGRAVRRWFLSRRTRPLDFVGPASR